MRIPGTKPRIENISLGNPRTNLQKQVPFEIHRRVALVRPIKLQSKGLTCFRDRRETRSLERDSVSEFR